MSHAARYQNYIHGQWIDSESGDFFENRNPADPADLIGLFPRSTEKDLEAAIAAAKDAFASWSRTPAPKRAELVFRLAELLMRKKSDFARAMTREMGKVLAETQGDVQEAIDLGYYTAGEGRRMFGQTTPSELPDKFAMSIRTPIGVCGFITPWNFPMAIPSWKMIPALVCGNTMVLKPATDTPLSSVHLVQACHEVGIPPGVVNLVSGSGRTVGIPMTKHPAVKLISFTGSTEVGRIVSQNAAPDFRRVHLEMGGKNAILVMEDADLDLAVDGAIWGGFGTTGQRCTAASRVIVQHQVYRPFLQRFIARAGNLRLGNGLLPETDMGPLVSESQLQNVMRYVSIGKKEGARLALGGDRCTSGDLAKGWFHQPTIFADVDPGMRIAQEEIFGPVVSVIPCKDLDEAIEIGNGVVYGLSSAIYTRDVNKAFRAMRDLVTGICYINASTIGAEVHLPFGGVKQTGNGHREAGQQALDFFSEWKSVYVDFSGKLQRAQIDNN